MTVKYSFLPLVALCVVVLGSCPGDGSGSQGEAKFWAMNMTNNSYYQVNAEKLAVGSKCVVWAEVGSGVTQELAEEVAWEYDSKIRPRVVDAFGLKYFALLDDEENKISFADILDMANWFAGRSDKKQTILLLDIKDGAKEGDPFVAGYFSPINLYKADDNDGSIYIGGNRYRTNARDMIYIDTNPGLAKNREQTYATLAHELQHLINFCSTLLFRDNLMDTWIDEGLSSYAEYLYHGDNLFDRCEWFIEDEGGTIAKGNNFFVWDNHSDDEVGGNTAILDDYATVYLFFRWLSLQANSSRIMFNIETSSDYDYQAVTAEAAKIKSEWGKWEPLLMNWLAANKNPGNSIYGYKGDTYLMENITVKPLGVGKISLYPGEGVYSIINTSFTPPAPAPSSNIRYAGLGSTITTTGIFTSDSLLTFNVSTDEENDSEDGTLTGVTPPSSASWQQARTVFTKKFTGRYVIDARDLLGRNRERTMPGNLILLRNESEDE